jgi:ribosomal protein L11 methyltransferase
VAAIEIDHEAIANAEENVSRNGVAERVTGHRGRCGGAPPARRAASRRAGDILSSVLLELLPSIRDALTADG